MEIIKRYLKFIKILLFSKSIKKSIILSKYKGSNNPNILKLLSVSNGFISLKKSNTSVPFYKMQIFNNDLQMVIHFSNYFSINDHESGLMFISTKEQIPIKIIVRIQDNVGVLNETIVDHAYFFKGNSIYNVIDVGMNVGIPSLFFASLPWVEKIYGYELVPNTYNWAKENFLINPILNDKISAYPFGMAEKDNELLIPEAYDGAVGASATDFVVKQQNEQYPWNTKKTKVTVRNAEILIREIISSSTNEIVLKLDCEGAEYEILELLSDKKLLQKISVLMIEWHLRGSEKISEILTENGFIHFSFEKPGSFSCGFIYGVRQKLSEY